MGAENKVDHIKTIAVGLLESRYGRREATWIVRAVFEDLMGWSMTDIVTRGDYELNQYTADKFRDMVDRVAAGEPVQYVTGHARFYGMTFIVNRKVLIPRPETAELVDLIVARNADRSDLHLLDCGTGSGCIAIALSRNLPFCHVEAMDIDSEALDVARANALKMSCKINFKQADIMNLPAAAVESRYDIIVSNPPYIADSERGEMESHVVDYEPHKALFVPDDDPVKFYRAIAEYAFKALTGGGQLWFEINPLFVNEIHTTLSCFDNVNFEKDSQGAVRFVSAIKSL